MRRGLSPTSRVCKFGNLKILSGIFPRNPQSLRCSDVKEEKFPMKLGKTEERLFSPRSSSDKKERLEMEEWIGPERPQELKLNLRRLRE